MTPWSLTYNGHTWTDQDVTLAHAAVVASLLDGDTWANVEPWGGPQRLGAWIVVLEASATGRNIEEVLHDVQALPLLTLAACLQTRDASLPAPEVPAGV